MSKIKENKECRLEAICSLIESDILWKDYKLIDAGSNSNVYKAFECDKVAVVSTCPAKFMCYKVSRKPNENINFIKFKKFNHIPKIWYMSEYVIGNKNLYVIVREELFAVSDTRKIARIQKIEELVKSETVGIDRIADEILALEDLLNFQFKVDFGPHWIMQDSKGKLVICDAFMQQ